MSEVHPSELSIAAATGVAGQMEEPAGAPINSREARIAQLSEQYRSGIYEADAMKVSAKIIDDVLRE